MEVKKFKGARLIRNFHYVSGVIRKEKLNGVFLKKTSVIFSEGMREHFLAVYVFAV